MPRDVDILAGFSSKVEAWAEDAKPFPVSHPYDPEPIFGMVESLASLALCLARRIEFDQPLAERIRFVLYTGEIFGFEPHFAATGKANIYAGFKVLPCDGYRRLFAALVENGYADGGEVDLHGWPVLSVVGGPSTVAEAGGAASASGGGLA